LKLVKEIEFQAKTENEAYQKARERLGPDGVILSIQSIRTASWIPFLGKKMLVIRAGILEEEKKFEQKTTDPELEKKQVEVFKALLEHKRSMKDIKQNKTSQEKLVEQIKDEIDIKGNTGTAFNAGSGTYANGQPAEPCSNKAEELIPPELEIMLENDMEEENAKQLLEEYRSLETNDLSFQEWLSIKTADYCFIPGGDLISSALGGNRIMLVGATGVGKTTTIAKIAAIAVQQGRKTALFTSDNYRVSAVEQIRTFARVLNLPLEVVNAGSELPERLNKYSSDTLILMDTAGHGFTEKDRITQIIDIHNNFHPDQVHMAISATARTRDMLNSIETLKKVLPVSRLILTKVDETLCPGSLLSIPMKTGIRLSFVTTGQNVPRDIGYADAGLLAQYILDGGTKG